MSNLTVEILNPDLYEEWNNFVDLSPQGDVFCYSWWLDTITRSNFKILVALEESEIVAGIPLAYDAQNEINEPPLTRTLGVLYKPRLHLSEYKQVSNRRKWLTALLEHIPGDDFVQTCASHNFDDWLPFRWKGFSQTTRYTYLLHYRGRTIDDLRRNLNGSIKNNINKAAKNDITVEESDDVALLYNFVSLSYMRQGLKLRLHFEDLDSLDRAIKKNGNRKIFKAVDRVKRVHAVNYIVFNQRSAYSLLSGSDPEYRRMGGHTLVLWEAVKYFSDKVEYFNFGGSDIKRLEEHRRGFGGVMTPYFHIYNERLLHSTDIRFHLNELMLHAIGVVKAIGIRLFKN